MLARSQLAVQIGANGEQRLHSKPALHRGLFTAAGRRLENVSINGTQVLSGFDIFAATGAQHKAIVKTFTANADPTLSGPTCTWTN
jgi:hypothetical protein